MNRVVNQIKQATDQVQFASYQELRHYQQQAFLQSNYEEQLALSLRGFHYFYEQGQLSEAIEQLWVGMSLFEFHQNDELKKQLLICCVKVSTFFVAVPNSHQLIEATIAYESPKSQPEILSMCFYLLSVRELMEKQYETSTTHAKLAYFYAMKIEGDRLFYECNAQLQIVCSLLEAGSLAHVEKYIEKFNWYVENCKNDQERVFVTCIQSTILFLQKQFDQSLAMMNMLLVKFSQSKEVMYSSYLAMHFKRILSKASSECVETQDLLALCDLVMERHALLVTEIQDAIPKSYILLPQQFYLTANEFVERLQERNERSYIVKFRLLNESLEEVLEILSDYRCRDIEYVIHQYTAKKFVFLCSDAERHVIETAIEENDSFVMIESISSETGKHQVFFQLYNDLNLAIIRKNLKAYN